MSEITLRLDRIEVKAPYASKTIELSSVDDIFLQISLSDDLCKEVQNTKIVGVEGLTQIVKICNSVLYFEEAEQEY